MNSTIEAGQENRIIRSSINISSRESVIPKVWSVRATQVVRESLYKQFNLNELKFLQLELSELERPELEPQGLNPQGYKLHGIEHPKLEQIHLKPHGLEPQGLQQLEPERI